MKILQMYKIHIQIIMMFLVASNSLPFYRDQVLDPYDKKINISKF